MQEECWCCSHWKLRACAVLLWRNGKTLLFRGYSRSLFWLLGQHPEVLVPRPVRRRDAFILTKEDFSSAEKKVKMWLSIIDNLAETDTLFTSNWLQGVVCYFLISPTYRMTNCHVCLELRGFLGCGTFSARTGKVPSNLPTELWEQENQSFQARKTQDEWVVLLFPYPVQVSMKQMSVHLEIHLLFCGPPAPCHLNVILEDKMEICTK